MSITPATLRKFVVLFYPPIQDNKQSSQEIKLNLASSNTHTRQSKIVCDGIEYKLDWDSPLGAFQNPLRNISLLIENRKYEQALKRIFFLTRTIVSNAVYETINANVLVKSLLQASHVFQKRGDWENALRYANFTCDLDPESVPANISTAIASRLSNQPYKALQHSEEAVYISPNDSRSRQTLAISYRAINLPAQALEHAEHALLLRPEEASSYITLVNILIDMKDFKYAREILEEGLKKLNSYEFNKISHFIGKGLESLDERVKQEFFSFAA